MKGYYETFQELIEETEWEQYGTQSGNPKCADCMVHCGYEPTAAVDAMQPQNMARSLGSLFGIAIASIPAVTDYACPRQSGYR
jgi:hypothetical protein